MYQLEVIIVYLQLVHKNRPSIIADLARNQRKLTTLLNKTLECALGSRAWLRFSRKSLEGVLSDSPHASVTMA